MKLPDKQRVRDAVVERLTLTLQHMAKTAEATRKDATHEEARPENDKDTRALEQTYLARGQAMRVEQLIEEREVLRFMPLPTFGADDALRAGALVQLESEAGEKRCVFVLPQAGGTEVEVDGVHVMVVTPTSSLGAAIVNRVLGDAVELRVRGVLKEYEITEVA
jgi:transcription elongation GreA/GreB family factor